MRTTFIGPVAFKALRLREQLWHLEGRKCHWCGRDTLLCVGSVPNQATIDHVISRGRGGSSHASNCVSACSACNSARNDKDVEESKAVARPPRTQSWRERGQQALRVLEAQKQVNKELTRQLEEYRTMSVWTFVRRRIGANLLGYARLPEW